MKVVVNRGSMTLTKPSACDPSRAMTLKLLGGLSIMGAVLFGGAALITPHAARAVPAFTQQTGQPCASCHVGGFGPELTPFGREFKLGGYTMRTQAAIPLGAGTIASWTHTRKDQASPPEHFSRNDNVALDDFSIFLAGGIGSHLGGFAEVSYDGIERNTSFEMLDLRAVTPAKIFGADSTLGFSANNAPMIQDAWNTLPKWGFPYVGSGVAPKPDTAPLVDMLMANVVGLTGYAWIGGKAYVEAGGYASPSRGTLRFIGVEDMPGSIDGVAPYSRIAWQTDLVGGTFEVGANAFKAAMLPMRDRSSGLSDRYTDLGIDSSWQKTLAKTDTLSLNFRYEHERGDLRASCVLGLVGDEVGNDVRCARYHLNTLRGTTGYNWHNKIGANLSAFSTTGSRNFSLFEGSGRPNSNGLTAQLDYTFWGRDKSPLGPRFNARVGVQYTIYGKFNGRRRNYDFQGRNAADNDALKMFTWIAF